MQKARHSNKYTAPYIYRKNGLAKKRWQTIVIMKNTMLIDNRLPNGFWAKVIETANDLLNKLPTRNKNYKKVIAKEC